jgi:hypothetical protein
LRLDGHGYSPALLQKIVTAGARLASFADAAFALGLSGLAISARHVQQLTHEVGTQMAQARDEQAHHRRRRELTPRAAPPPAVVAVEVDGGRLRTRAPAGARASTRRRTRRLRSPVWSRSPTSSMPRIRNRKRRRRSSNRGGFNAWCSRWPARRASGRLRRTNRPRDRRRTPRPHRRWRRGPTPSRAVVAAAVGADLRGQHGPQ